MMREWKLKTLPETKGSLLEDRLTSYIQKQVGWEPDYPTGPLRLIYANIYFSRSVFEGI